MNRQYGGRVKVIWLALFALAAGAVLYAATPARLAPAAAAGPPDDYGIVHSFPDDDDPPPCGVFATTCYIRT